MRDLVAALPPRAVGIGLFLLSGILFSMMQGFARIASADMHPFEVAFFRSLFGLAMLAPMLFRAGIGSLRTQKFHLHAGRAFFQMMALVCGFTAVAITPLATVAALGFAAPLFATLGAILLMGERAGMRRWGALAIGFAGTLIVLRPGAAEIGTGPLVALLAAASWASTMLFIKAMGKTESSVTQVAYMGLMVTPMTLALAVFFWTWPDWDTLLVIAGLGFCGTAGHLAFAQAMKSAETSALMPLDFLRLIWISIIGFVLFQEVPDLWAWIGGAVIFVSATYVTLREARLRDTADKKNGAQEQETS